MNMYAKQTSGGDAVVPTLNANAVYSNGFHQQAGPPQPAGPPLFSGPSAFSAPGKFPGYEQPGEPHSLLFEHTSHGGPEEGIFPFKAKLLTSLQRPQMFCDSLERATDLIWSLTDDLLHCARSQVAACWLPSSSL